VFGYYQGSFLESLDVDASPYPVFNYGPIGSNDYKISRTRQVSDELQLQGKALDRRLDYIFGAYYSHSRLTDYNPQYVFDFSPVSPGGLYTLDALTRETSKAVFAQGTYDLGAIGLDKFAVTAGFRYTWVDVALDQLPQSVYLGTGDAHLATTFSKPSWQFGLDYKPTGALMLYIVQRGSWRSGGFSDSTAPLPGTANVGGAAFLPETVKDVEAGVKYNGRLASMPMRLTVSGFYQWINNVQRELAVTGPSGATGALTVNVPEAQVKGVEFDAQIRPARLLTIGGLFTYVDARYTDPYITLAELPGQTAKVGPYADTPAVSGTGYVRVDLPLDPGLGEIALRGDIYAQTHTFFSSFNDSLNPDTRLPGYKLVNARVDWSHMFGSKFSAAAYVNNLTNQVYYTGGLANGFLLGINVANVGAPRTYGVEVKVEF
jgi:iron complex outermembrane recepter protein